MNYFKFAAAALITLFLCACGGSSEFSPVITGVKVQSLRYGHTATIYLGGKNLRSSLVVDTGGMCDNPSFASNSNTDTLVFNCGVKAVGEMHLVIKTDKGEVVYTTKLTVPKPQVSIFTSKGVITVELDPTIAPVSTNNFLAYVGIGFYKNTLFHRVIQSFVIQAGGYTAGMVKQPPLYAPIELESNKGLSNLRGTIAMARTGVFNSATTEFYINLTDNLSLDYQNSTNPGYAVFGKVVQGIDVVDAIASEPTGVLNGFADLPLQDITISLTLQTL
jgi:peptidyl-prolyl cis-trans isomerase A (cyclophilin A)